MDTMTVHMVGLAYLNVCGRSDKGKYALVPNGRDSDGEIPQHYASIFVEEARCERDNWWPDEKKKHTLRILNLRGEPVEVNVFEFRIPKRSEVTFPDGDTGKVTLNNLEKGLGHLKTVDPDFDPDLDDGDWIARIAIRGGTLDALTLNGGVSTVQWRTGQDGPLTITATETPRRRDVIGGSTETRTTCSVTVRPQDGPLGAEVVFMNAPDLISAIDPTRGPLRVRARVPHGPAHPHIHERDESHHFRLYGKINRRGNASRLKIPAHLRSMEYGHALLKYIGDLRVHNSCTLTCC